MPTVVYELAVAAGTVCFGAPRQPLLLPLPTSDASAVTDVAVAEHLLPSPK